MENVYIWLKIAIAVATFLIVTVIPTVFLLIKKWKEAKNAKTEAEKQEAYNEMYDIAHSLIMAAEETYKQVDEILKNKSGAGSGAVKKDSVMTKLQAYCIEKGFTFDSEYWSAKVDEIVAMTKHVNAKGE